MEELTLKATPREILGKKVKKLRDQNQLPGIIYGKNFNDLSVSLPAADFKRVSSVAGESTLINMEIPDQKPIRVLIRDLQRDAVTGDILHVDLYKVDMTEKIQTEIPLEFVGESPAVEELEGNLITNKNSVRVECLPDKLVPQIPVDVSLLKTFDDLIHISDLKIPEGIKVLDDTEEVIAQVTPPRSEEEIEQLEAEAKAAADTEKEHIENIEAQAEAEKAKEEAETEEEQPPTGNKEENK